MTRSPFQILYHTFLVSYKWSGLKLNVHPFHSTSLTCFWDLLLNSNQFHYHGFFFNNLDQHFSFHWRKFCPRHFQKTHHSWSTLCNIQPALIKRQNSIDDARDFLMTSLILMILYETLCFTLYWIST